MDLQVHEEDNVHGVCSGTVQYVRGCGWIYAHVIGGRYHHTLQVKSCGGSVSHQQGVRFIDWFGANALHTEELTPW